MPVLWLSWLDASSTILVWKKRNKVLEVMCSLIFPTVVYYSQGIGSFIAKGGKGPTSLPNLNGARLECHQPLVPQQATREKGKKRSGQRQQQSTQVS